MSRIGHGALLCTAVVLCACATSVASPSPTEAPSVARSAITSAAASPSPAPTQTRSPLPTVSPTIDDIVRKGDVVTMSGNIVEWSDGKALCSDFELLTLYPHGLSVSCAVPAVVPVTNIDPRSLDGSDDNLDHLWVTSYVTVTGIWNEGVIDVTETSLAERPGDSSGTSTVPCTPPPDGWTRQAGSDTDIESASLALDREVSRHPERYSGHWDARQDSTTDPGESYFIAVVATAGDVDAANETLAAVYPYNLCVVHLPVSAADLGRIQQPGRVPGEETSPTLSLTSEGFVLTLSVLDEATSRVLGSDLDGIIVRPLIRKLTDGSAR